MTGRKTAEVPATTVPGTTVPATTVPTATVPAAGARVRGTWARLVPAPAGKRLARLFVGLVLYTLSIAMLVTSELGAMPWDVLSQGVSRRTGVSMGTATVAISVVVLLCWWPLRQRPGVGTIANLVVIGALLDPALALVGLLPDPLAVRVALAVGGILVNGLATALYVGAALGPGPRDGLMTGIVARTGRPVVVVRTAIEVAVVTVGILLGGTFGPATVAYALGVGSVVHVLLPRLRV